MTPSDTLDVYDVAFRVGRALESSGVPYFLGGSLASSLQGEARATNDLDFVVDLRVEQIVNLADALGPDFDVDQESLADAVRRGRSWNVYFLPTVYKVDLFQKGATPFDEQEFARRRRFDLGEGRSIFVKSAEDTVLRKLLWFRQGGEVATHQWRDVVQVLRVNAHLDATYLDHWSHALAIGDLLKKARQTAASR